MDVNTKIEKTVEWLKDQASKTKTQGLAVGVSGGIDSAVVAYLIKKAQPNSSIGVVLPCANSKQDVDDAKKVIEACGISSVEINLAHIHGELTREIFEQLEHTNKMDGNSTKIAVANLKARLRMGILYTIANALNYLVVGTDNAAEMYVGYFTKYGDGGVDIQPMVHLTKREVREWAKVLGVPQSIIDKVPTAGLWEGQTDEGEMGTTYDRVDDLLDGKHVPEKDRLIIERLHKGSGHKRSLPPGPPREWYIDEERG